MPPASPRQRQSASAPVGAITRSRWPIARPVHGTSTSVPGPYGRRPPRALALVSAPGLREAARPTRSSAARNSTASDRRTLPVRTIALSRSPKTRLPTTAAVSGSTTATTEAVVARTTKNNRYASAVGTAPGRGSGPRSMPDAPCRAGGLPAEPSAEGTPCPPRSRSPWTRTRHPRSLGRRSGPATSRPRSRRRRAARIRYPGGERGRCSRPHPPSAAPDRRRRSPPRRFRRRRCARPV